ncbi:hypothetical protein T492DRAFT_866698 [Pavlovales sp. CCMP2436]|nr:hypothetical protein T492DRAFT_866698 [Pavlovales sp. CCMP2436]
MDEETLERNDKSDSDVVMGTEREDVGIGAGSELAESAELLHAVSHDPRAALGLDPDAGIWQIAKQAFINLAAPLVLVSNGKVNVLFERATRGRLLMSIKTTGLALPGFFDGARPWLTCGARAGEVAADDEVVCTISPILGVAVFAASAPMSSMYEAHVQAHADAVGELKLRARGLDKGLRSLRTVKLFVEKLAEQHREHARTLGKLAAPGKATQADLGGSALQGAWDALCEGVVAGARHHATLAAELESAVVRPLDAYSAQAPRAVRAAVSEAEACERKLISATTNATRAAVNIARSWEESAALKEADSKLRADPETGRADGPGPARLLKLLEMASDARDAHVVLDSKAHSALAEANELHAELYAKVKEN